MGQGQSVEEWKATFNSLDVDQSGRLNLRELLSSNLPEVADSSIGFLFRFDTSREGTINFDEFQELVKHLRRLEERSHKKKSNFSLMKLLRKESRTPSDQATWKTLDSKDTGSLVLGRDKATPAFVGNKKSRSLDLEREKTEADKLREAEKTKDELKTRNVLGQSFKKADGRQKFMDWLFKLADIDKSDRISSEELELVLQALSRDQINTAELSYDQENISPLLLQSIMGEYDMGKTGYLTKTEFMVLADLIVRNYDTLVAEQSRTQIVGDYILRWKLGEGASGVVRLGSHKVTKKQVAIKIIPKGDASDLSRVDNEIKAMLMLSHPNVVELHEVFEGEENVFFVMELCGGGSLAEYADIHALPEELASNYFYQLVEAVSYCHSKGVVHRDLKLENLLLANDGIVHVSDFGHAGIFQQGWDMFSTAVGSLLHLSPEQINGECYSGEKTDTWAVGVALYRMVVGKPPFFSSDINELLENITNVKYSTPIGLSEHVTDLLALILKFNPKERPSLETILNHPWLANNKSSNPSIRVFPFPRVHPSKFPTDQMIDAMHDLNIVVVTSEASMDDSSTFCFLKCHFAAKELKFSVALKKVRAEKQAAKKTLFRATSSHQDVEPVFSATRSKTEPQKRSVCVSESKGPGATRSPTRLEDYDPKREEEKQQKRKKKRSSTVMEIQLRQGNLSSLNKILDKLLAAPCFLATNKLS